MVDHSTQTPRDEGTNKHEELNVDGETTAGSADSVPDENKQDDDGAEAEESGADKYDDEEFEESPEKDKENGTSDSEAKEEPDEKEDEKDEDYNEDFESDEEKERDKSSDEDEDDKESEKEDEEDPEDDIQDETEDKEKTETGKEEQAEEVEDETDKEKQDNAERPTSATDSEGRQSKNVSFDEDVTVIEDEQEEGEKEEDEEENPEDAPEEVAEQNDQEDPGVDKAEQETEDIPEKVALESPRQGQDKDVSRYPEARHRQDDEQERHDAVRSPEPSDSSSSSSSSGSESSDSQDEGQKARRSKKKKKGKAKSRPGQDPGSDPDLVSSGQLPEQALKAVGVQPGTKHDGSVQSLLGGKDDVELVGVALTKEQFEEVARIIDSREDLGTVILRNTSADDSVLETLAASLINSPNLKMLNLSVNRIGPEGAKHLADVIRQNKSLRMLLLHGNPLTDEGVGIIIDAIVETTDTSIMNLDLGDCGLTQDGAKHIAKLIEHNSTVTVLTISGNTIQLEGWQNISKTLSTNSTLETLSLDFNKIGDEEAITIAEGIQGCKSLRSVDLEGNKIGDEGGRKLFVAVKANKSIVDLTLAPINQISKEIVDEVKDFLKEREKGNEPEEAGGGEEQHETEDSALQPQQDSLVTEGSRETSHEESVSEYPPTQENSEGRQEQKGSEGEMKVKQGEEPMAESGTIQEEQGTEEGDKEADDREQPSGDDQPNEKEDPTAEENAAPAGGAGHLPDADHPEHQEVALAEDDQDGNEPQQDPQKSDNKQGQESPQRGQPQILEDPGESTGLESPGQDPSEQEREKEDNVHQDPILSVDLGVNDADQEASKRASSTEGEGNDKQEGLDKGTEDEQVAGASSPGEDPQQNSSDAS